MNKRTASLSHLSSFHRHTPRSQIPSAVCSSHQEFQVLGSIPAHQECSSITRSGAFCSELPQIQQESSRDPQAAFLLLYPGHASSGWNLGRMLRNPRPGLAFSFCIIPHLYSLMNSYRRLWQQPWDVFIGNIGNKGKPSQSFWLSLEWEMWENRGITDVKSDFWVRSKGHKYSRFLSTPKIPQALGGIHWSGRKNTEEKREQD